jgi:uncharacterized RmlC-like cupin family protein
MADGERRRQLARRQSARLATAATRKALSELTPPSRERARQRGLTTARPVLKTVADVLAQATQPAITWSVSPEGKLETPDIRGTARHEVAHFSLPGTKRGRFFGQHFAMRAAGAQGELLSVPSGVALRQAEAAARLPSGRRIARAVKFRLARTRRPQSEVSSTARTPTQQKRARERVGRLRRRLRGRTGF